MKILLLILAVTLVSARHPRWFDRQGSGPVERGSATEPEERGSATGPEERGSASGPEERGSASGPEERLGDLGFDMNWIRVDRRESPDQTDAKRDCFDDLRDLKQKIEDDLERLDELAAEMRRILQDQDQADVEPVMVEVNETMRRVQLRTFMFRQLNDTCLRMAHDLECIHDRWEGVQFDSNMKEILEALAEAEKLKEEVQSSLGLHHHEERELVRRAACNAVPNTNNFVSLVGQLETNAKNDQACIKSVQTRAKQVKTSIEAFHKTTALTKKVKDFINGLYNTLLILSKLPYVGGIAGTFKNVVGTGKSKVDTAYSKMKTIDDKIYPSWRDKSKKVETAAKNSNKALKKVEKMARITHQVSGAARDCVCEMPSGSSVKSTAENTCGSLVSTPQTLNQAVGRVASVCSAYDNMLSKFEISVPTGILTSVYNMLNSFFSALGPIADIFGEINNCLTWQLCIPNPIELAREAAERTWEWTKERAEEVAEGVKSIFSGWRKRRSVFMKRETALDMIGNRATRMRRASDICFSIQDIINGISSVFSALFGWAEDILNGIMARIPGLDSLPGLPSFDFNFDLVGGLPWPNLDFLDMEIDLNLDKLLKFLTLDLPTLTFGIDLPSLGVSLPSLPNLALPDFDPDFWNPSFSIPNLSLCRNMGKKKRFFNAIFNRRHR